MALVAIHCRLCKKRIGIAGSLAQIPYRTVTIGGKQVPAHIGKCPKQTHGQVIDKDAAALIERNLTNLKVQGMACPTCSKEHDHHVIRHSKVDKWVLYCGHCGERVRELNWEEVL